jgi:hypothetical protein
MDLDIFKKIKVSDITLDKETVKSVLKDIKQGDISRTREPVMVMYDSVGDLIVFDGFHRLLEHALVSEEEIEVNIIFDERSGEKCEDAHRINKEERLNISGDLVNQDLSFAYSKEETEEIKSEYLNFLLKKDFNPFVDVNGLYDAYKILIEGKDDYSKNHQNQILVNTILLENKIPNLFNTEELNEKFYITEQLQKKINPKITKKIKP